MAFVGVLPNCKFRINLTIIPACIRLQFRFETDCHSAGNPTNVPIQNESNQTVVVVRQRHSVAL